MSQNVYYIKIVSKYLKMSQNVLNVAKCLKCRKMYKMSLNVSKSSQNVFKPVLTDIDVQDGGDARIYDALINRTNMLFEKRRLIAPKLQESSLYLIVKLL
jgi:hypothetical protein